MDKRMLDILRHSVGLDDNGKGKMYRNHFVTGPGSKDFEYCQHLVQLGLMKDLGKREIWGDMHCFIVTSDGFQILKNGR